MSKTFRAGILLITLAIPAFIIFFLHGFGENEFDVPVYYSDGIDTAFADCQWQQPHLVREFTDQLDLENNISVLAITADSNYDLNLLSRIGVDYQNYDNFQAILIYETDILIPERLDKSIRVIQGKEFSEIMACQLVIQVWKDAMVSKISRHFLVLSTADCFGQCYFV